MKTAEATGASQSADSFSMPGLAEEQWQIAGLPPGASDSSAPASQVAARLKLVLGLRRMVAVTGLADTDGATRLAALLAEALVAIDQCTVLLVDGNVRRSRLNEVLAIPKSPGLLDLLEETVSLEQAARTFHPANLSILPLGEGARSLASVLSNPASTRVIREIRERYRYILIDVGVMTSDPAGMMLASLCDGVVAALAAGSRRRHEVVEFQTELERLKIPLLGAVLTRGGAEKR